MSEAGTHYERALAGWLAWRGDPRSDAQRAIAADPVWVPGHLLEASLHLCSRDPADMPAAHRALQQANVLARSAGERLHAAAIGTALGGDYDGARTLLGCLLAQQPRNLLALAVAHTLDHYLGDTRGLRARLQAALPAWTESAPGYAGVLAMHAFGLEECGEYSRAEAAALEALERDPGSLRAHHALFHVREMQGRAAEGLRWALERAEHWDGAGASATHLRWHLSLYQIALGDARGALASYDGIAAGGTLSELIDASALLWRLALRGVDLGARWQLLAQRWAPRAEEAFCAFNDLHAMLAFVGAGRRDLQRRLLHAQRRRLLRGGTNHGMLRAVGLPASLALEAFGREDFGKAAALLRGLPAVSHRLGGSHAQRGLIGLTLQAADRNSASWSARQRSLPEPVRGSASMNASLRGAL